MALQLEAATVDDQFSAFINALLNPALDLRLVRGRDDWTVMCFRIGGNADAQGVHRGDQLFAQCVGGLFTHRRHDWQRHAALARRTERSARKIVHHLIEVGVGHDDAMILRAAHGLYALARLNRSEERRVGTECVSTCRYGWSPYR